MVVGKRDRVEPCFRRGSVGYARLEIRKSS